MLNFDISNDITVLDIARYYKSLCEIQNKILDDMNIKSEEYESPPDYFDNTIVHYQTYTFPQYTCGVKLKVKPEEYKKLFSKKNHYDQLFNKY